MPSIKNHPHKYTLDLLKLAIDNLPVTVPTDLVDQAYSDYEALAENPKISVETIEGKIAEVGKLSWPYRKAYQDLFEKLGKADQEAAFQEKLSPELRKKYTAWIKTGHSIDDVRHGQDFEQSFTGDERYQIEEALLNAKEEVKEKMDMLVVGDKKREYDERLKYWQERQKLVDEKIQQLRALAHDSPKWSAEISNKASLYEEGWALVERDPDPYEVEKEIEYWSGMMEAT